MRTTRPTYTKGAVTSADGTAIGSRRLGAGPGVVLLHGGVNAAQHMMRLGVALADAFTVYLPDRRGRGMSGPFGPAYSIEREDEDVAALVDHTGAELVFGPADGGLFALHAALGLDRVIRKVAVYEPLLLLGRRDDVEIRRIFTTLQALIRSGRGGEGIVFSAAGTASRAARDGNFPAWLADALGRLPAGPTGRLVDLLLQLQRTGGDTVAWRDLLVALPPELDLVLATEGTVEQYRHLEADVLLMVGGKTDPMFVATAEELHRVLPRSTLLRLPGLDHDSAQTYGKPDAIAVALRLFFAS